MADKSVGYFMLLVLLVSGSTSSGETKNAANSFIVGVIASGSGSVESHSVAKFGYNITSVWSLVDTSELYMVFAAVQRFERRSDIDIVLLFDWDARLHKDTRILAEGRTQLMIFDNLKKQEMHDPESVTCEETKPTILVCDADLNSEASLTDSSDTINSNAMASAIVTKALKQLIVDSLHWTQLYILHENATDKETKDFVDALSLVGVMTAIYNLDTTPDFNATLAKIYHSTLHVKPEMNFVVPCRPQCVKKILTIANRFDSHKAIDTTLLKQFSRWLIAGFGHSRHMTHSNIQCTRDIGLNNVAILAIPDVVALSSKDVTNVMGAFVEELRSKVIDDPTLAEFMSKADMIDLFLKKAKTWHPSARCKGFKIDTLLWTTNGRELNTVGTVDIHGHLSLQSEVFPNIKYGYNKRQFIVSTLPWDPFVIKHNDVVKDKTTGEPTGNVTVRYEGLTIDMLQELARVLNFTYVLIEPVDQKWGGIDIAENLTFNGMIGQVQRLECDFVAAPLTIQPIRELVVDFSYPYFYEYTTVLVKRIDPQTEKWRMLVDPLRGEVLLSIGVGLAIVSLLIYILEKYNPFYAIPAQGENRTTHSGLHHLHNSFLYMYGCLMYQDCIWGPGSIAGRTFVSCWRLTCIVVVGIYCGNLIAFLTVTKEKPPFNTLEEMVEMKDIVYGLAGGGVWDISIMNSSAPIFKKIADGIRQFQETDHHVLHPSAKYHIDRVRDGSYAWIGDLSSMEVYTVDDCDLIKIREQFLPMQYGFAFPENSMHRLIFSKQIMAMHESGLLQIWKRKWWPKSKCALRKTSAKATPISLINVQSAFYVCVIGTCVSLIAFAVEHVVYRLRCCRDRCYGGNK